MIVCGCMRVYVYSGTTRERLEQFQPNLVEGGGCREGNETPRAGNSAST